jgi:hypothetical protein
LAVKEFEAIAVAAYPMGGLHNVYNDAMFELALTAEAAFTARTL